MKEEKKGKDEMTGCAPQAVQAPQVPQPPQIPQMPQMPQMMYMPHVMPGQEMISQPPVVCCPYLLKLQCPMLQYQSMQGMSGAFPGSYYLIGGQYTCGSPYSMYSPYTANPYMNYPGTCG